MGSKCRLILVNLIDPNPIVVVDVLNHIKSQAPGLIMNGSAGVLHYSGDELLLVAFLDLNRGDYYVYGASVHYKIPDSLPILARCSFSQMVSNRRKRKRVTDLDGYGLELGNHCKTSMVVDKSSVSNITRLRV